jgi:hypothetical protein
MKACIAISAMVMATAAGYSHAADAISPDIFQANVTVSIPAGSSNATVAASTLPVNKRLVIQTVTVYAGGGTAGSTTRVFVAANIFNTVSYLAIPDIYIDTIPFASTTLSATFYAGAGSTLYVNAYRNDSTQAEILNVTISGYYVAKP